MKTGSQESDKKVSFCWNHMDSYGERFVIIKERAALRMYTYESSSVEDVVGNRDGAVHGELLSLALLSDGSLLLQTRDGHD